jgi:protein O-mannosyl-transferase
LPFLPTLWAGFLYDDGSTIVGNPFIKRPSNLGHFFSHEYFTSVEDNNRPVMILSMTLDYGIWGLKATGFHLQNLLLHGVASMLVYRAALRIVPVGRGALIAGLLFAVHPIHTEVVAAINYREDLLVTCFALATFLAFDGPATVKRLVLGSCAFVLALFSKESALALPAALLLGDLMRLPAALARKRLPRHVWLGLLALVLFVPFQAAFPTRGITALELNRCAVAGGGRDQVGKRGD